MLNRRRTLQALAALCPGAVLADQQRTLATFRHGVASGDPTRDSVVLWTRLSGVTSQAEVQWQIARVEDGSFYHPLFVHALATMLASRLAGPLTGSRNLPQELLQEYEAITGPRARLADAFEDRVRRKMPWVESDLVNARFTRYPYA